MLWFFLAAITGAPLVSILWPLRAGRAAGVRASSEVAFLTRQLAGIDSEIAQGLADPAFAQASRAEIGRRLIAASKADIVASGPDAGPPSNRRRVASAALVAVVPLLAFGLYVRLGEPDSSAPAPLPQANAQGAAPDMAAMIAQVEAHLEKTPDDGRGYEVIAPVYMRLGRYDDAGRALASVIRILGPSAERQAQLGEALFASAGSIVTADARAAFEAATALDAVHPKARYYLGLAAQQEGDGAKAAAIWSALLKDAPPDAPWLAAVQQGLAALKGPQSNPDAAQAIAGLAAPQQQAMIRQMVDGLAVRLASDGKDLAGWQKLVRAYTVLKDPEKAKLALQGARAAFAGDAAAATTLDGLAHDLGLDAS